MLEILLGLALAAQQAIVDTAPPLRIEAGWVREAPPGANVLAAYATFCNDEAAAVTIAAVDSAAFDRVEMHAVGEKGDAVTMEPLNSIVIGPGECVAFAPGGRHLMLFDPSQRLAAGEQVEFTFRLADGQEVEASFPVQRAEEVLDRHEHHH